MSSTLTQAAQNESKKTHIVPSGKVYRQLFEAQVSTNDATML